ncbi:MAG: glycosyltransferase [Planctomycetota bacterium]
MTRVAICVVTARRPGELDRLLDGLAGLDLPDPPPDVSVLVVDNDPDESARAVCDGRRAAFRWPLRYDVEPRRGIPFARNTAVARAAPGADLVAFIDDDEVPDPGWLRALLEARERFDADVVTGPALPVLPPDAPAWVRTGRVFEARRHPTGHRVPHAYTNNVLASAAVFEAMGRHFDERLARAGGSDAELFRRVHLAGFSIVWVDEAVVHDHVPAERATLGWVLQRTFRYGNSWAMVGTWTRPGWRTRLRLLAWAAWMVIKAVVLLPAALVTGRRGLVRSLRHAWNAAGVVSGVVGHRYEEYARRDRRARQAGGTEAEPDTAAPARVAVCAATYRRPEGLRRLLEGLAALAFADRRPEIEVIVVDNDPERSAAPICRAAGDGAAVRYVSEPVRGIAPARNAAVRAVGDDADWIAFIDDDEVPDPAWLDRLLAAARRYRADVVAGPVVPHFAEPVPDWVERGRFFDLPRHATGTELDRAYTGNVLVRAALLRRHRAPFDERLALVGGEDIQLFRTLHRAGAIIVWADDAVATEWVPATRATAAWLVRRMMRVGTATAHADLELDPGPGTALGLLARGAAWVVLGAAATVVGLVTGRVRRVRGRQWIAYGAGLASGVFGRRHEEYRDVHGS